MTIASASAAEATKLAELQRLRDRSPAIQPEKGRPPDRDCRGEMELRDVYFAYPARPSQPVLQGCSIQIQPEAVTALVGHSGCGNLLILTPQSVHCNLKQPLRVHVEFLSSPCCQCHLL